jgi:two-component sensor histidine kinase
MCRSISRSKLENRNIELVLVERPFQMSSERCWLLGMIVVELIINAVPHAFRQEGGTIRIECRASGEFVEWWVSDNGSCSTADVRPSSGSGSSNRLRKFLMRTFSLILERMERVYSNSSNRTGPLR